MGVVLLFDVGLIVLVIRPGAGLLDGNVTISEVAHQMPVEELPAVVCIDPLQGKGQTGFDALERLAGAVLTAIPGRTGFCPSRRDICASQRPNKVSLHRAAA